MKEGTIEVCHYRVLEVPPSSSLQSIKASYQIKARQFHPDRKNRVPDDHQKEDGEAFLRIQKAWECLRDPTLRREYDALLLRQANASSKSQALAREEWELVEDEETGDLCFVHSCRCGEELWLLQNQLLLEVGEDGDTKTFVACPGCSLVFHVLRREFVG